ncbi:hypothetical protein DSO57_1011819 [Entomophthora muscae]|uniref:Uncharacterized protein n=1 Tax=Entomophthora muscae TaxID=34485 RepID=A0ACC2UFR2_9FUNG|nr:hypothetical protein DSO57_1011819 [Entomophthora muscae]
MKLILLISSALALNAPEHTPSKIQHGGVVKTYVKTEMECKDEYKISFEARSNFDGARICMLQASDIQCHNGKYTKSCYDLNSAPIMADCIYMNATYGKKSPSDVFTVYIQTPHINPQLENKAWLEITETCGKSFTKFTSPGFPLVTKLDVIV